MNEKKPRNNGTLKISGNALLKIAETAAAEVDGIVLDAAGRLAPLKSLIPLGGLFYSPVRVRFSADSVIIEVTVVVKQGYKAHTTAEAIQENVKSAVQNMTGIAVSKVNVKIAGLVLEKTETEAE